MNKASTAGRNPSPAHIAGAASMLLSGGLVFVRAEMAAVPLGLFVLSCLAAPFLPRSGFFLPVISRGTGDRRAVSLTFDDGPDPDVTPGLLDLLDRHRLPATFFVVGVEAKRHPALIREILSRGHAVGNHSYHHDPLLMLRSRARLCDEITRAQELLSGFGIRPRAFRPPVGITNPRLRGVLRTLDMDCVTFSCRAGDFGNRRIRGLAKGILSRIRPGAVVLLHDVTPSGDGGIADWMEEMEQIVLGLKAKGYEVVPLSQLTGRPVMEPATLPRSGAVPESRKGPEEK